MATNVSSETLKTLCECPLCFEPYKDPRLLKCGHQFCEDCVRNVAKQTTRGYVPCPVCREVTKPPLGDVASLPRSVLLQCIQEVILQEPRGQKNPGPTLCSRCHQVEPIRHCLECPSGMSYLCDRCYTIHDQIPRLSRHQSVVYKSRLVCARHPHRMVESHCHVCKVDICVDCVFGDHANHLTDNTTTEHMEDTHKTTNGKNAIITFTDISSP